jgi:four helix bundle protein
MPFEDLDVWQRSRRFAKQIYEISGDGDFVRDFGLKDQVRRSAVSVLSNIAEGYERRSPNEFRNFLNIAKGSAGELRAQLYLVMDLGYKKQDEIRPMITEISEISRMIVGLMRSRENRKS